MFLSIFLTIFFSLYVHWMVIFGISIQFLSLLHRRHHARNCSKNCCASVCRYGKHGSFAFRGSGDRVLLWVSCLVTRRITTRMSRGRPGFNSRPRKNFVLMLHADQVCSAMQRPIHRSRYVEVFFLDGVTQSTIGRHSGRTTLFQVARGLHRCSEKTACCSA